MAASRIHAGSDVELLVSASILGADYLHLGDAIHLAEVSGSDLLQLDVADGIFVPTITFGEGLAKLIREATSLPLEVHLMVSRPGDWIPVMADLGADFVLFHAEAVSRLHATVEQARMHGLGIGVALNTETPPTAVEYVLPYIDLVTVMAILPGFAGQPFVPGTLNKIAALRTLIDASAKPDVLIEVDGGIKPNNVSEVVSAGADIVAVSSAIYSSENPRSAVRDLKDRAARVFRDPERADRIRQSSFVRRMHSRRFPVGASRDAISSS